MKVWRKEPPQKQKAAKQRMQEAFIVLTLTNTTLLMQMRSCREHGLIPAIITRTGS